MKIFIISWFLVVSMVSAKTNSPKGLHILGKIDGESDAQTSFVTLRFNKKIAIKKPALVDHGSFFELTLPKTLVSEPGTFINISSPFIKKVVAFQLDPSIAAVRLFLDRKGSELQQASQLDVLHDRIVFTIDHSKIENADLVLGSSRGKTIAVEKIIDQTEIRDDISDPASQVYMGGTINSSTKLRNALEKAAMFSAAMILLAFIFFAIKRNRILKFGTKSIAKEAMTVLSSKNLTPKHKLTLVEVDGQKVLLGVGPEGVNFLTSIAHTKAATSIPKPPPEIYQHQHITHQPSGMKEFPVPNPSDNIRAPAAETTQFKVKPEPFRPTPSENPEKTIKVYKNNATTKESSASSQSIDDIRKIIRNRLKDLPTTE